MGSLSSFWRLRKRDKSAENRTPTAWRRYRPTVEILEDRLCPSGDFGFAIGAGFTGVDQGAAVVTDLAGNVYVTGAYTGTVDFDPGTGVNAVIRFSMQEE